MHRVFVRTPGRGLYGTYLESQRGRKSTDRALLSLPRAPPHHHPLLPSFVLCCSSLTHHRPVVASSFLLHPSCPLSPCEQARSVGCGPSASPRFQLLDGCLSTAACVLKACAHDCVAVLIEQCCVPSCRIVNDPARSTTALPPPRVTNTTASTLIKAQRKTPPQDSAA